MCNCYNIPLLVVDNFAIVIHKRYIGQIFVVNNLKIEVDYDRHLCCSCRVDSVINLAHTPTAICKPLPVSEETPQFRDIWIQNVICRGARRAIGVRP